MLSLYHVITPPPPVDDMKGVGPKLRDKLLELDIRNANDVLFQLPSGYENLSVMDLTEARHNDKVTVEGHIKTEPALAFFRGGKSRLTVFMEVNGMYVKVVFFNQPYLKDKLKVGGSARISGKFNLHKLEINAQKLIFDASGGFHVKYYLGGVMHSKTFSKIVAEVFEKCIFNYDLPEDLKQKYRLLSVREALWHLHFPQNPHDINEARRTIKFYELFIFQLQLMEKRKQERVRNERYIVDYDVEALREFIDTLPFELTSDQKRSANEICRDLKQNISMHRLLQGDVGSGKTIVAGLASYAIKTIGEQTALMVPTEVLANQHYQSFMEIFDGRLNIAKLTGTTTRKEKMYIQEALREGEIDLLIGTHALIEDDVVFKRLSLIITDEQHRFGVNQRKRLNDKSYRKNVLYMTATPIPRTLSITTFGDMDISIIKEMPKGRKPVETYWRRFDETDEVLDALADEIKKGHSAYIVAPLIEESETLDLKNVQEIFQLFTDRFGEENVELVHGRMKPEEKAAGMKRFETYEKPVLVSTTVIEVGINVPNATFMVIFNAERFGLSTLHQLRGRVGRSDKQSYCVLISDPKTENAKLRMDIMTSTTDGFELSERDLEMRGPGDYFGVRQSGLPQFKVADLAEDYRVLEHARMSAIDYAAKMEADG
ncbi:ATP-dependent DNA helicase RecG [Salinicoccus hispanicus]|uniref:ATP-dependent DNA helicase RecG n=1 Tax=Salinicoccus hispanicus TaxID=157225 RepID=A0A6N8U2G4_9STAP|nr:ATP-dependent DNA helicase RecG [Salinicoccus hispanicus]MXQ49849.1 ATP-dependent DNA helicase RecG [Salinicoccus hispanicus]